ncbi:MAG: GatB [Candidatus Parvarchaeum acidiphilum ARMAN-4]|jgi:aspartyl-tRNA(Asn)/glutamyl-tRNA(Gln) amidotransferase subunit B|uniref:GatB n=1 Tax=Candidatus Parvarchaeum acidiphilum ARMAN-4 TaxID=662760 RepID=D2EF88_PARA4|nr:MAG: GatB [Candidatus Parvarchaeum acidiphilum ARMAN-4]
MKIGLEVHVALPTKTKLFCSDLAYENQEEPNSNVCPVCLGLPGAKPVLNQKALEISTSIAKALNCEINEKTWFVRKVYFYPDLPKGYQITQLDGAVGIKGYVNLNGKRIGIRRVQIEEDPARIIREKDYSLIDFNRSGVPLNEIVTEPDITSLDELKGFIEELRSILYYQGVNINQELKTDLNISLAEKRVEIKNVTGVRNLIAAAEYEIRRQSSLIQEGKEINAETRSYKEDTDETVSSREKETEEEYGFTFEPDLTFYDTTKLSIQKAVIASSVAKELAYKQEYNEKTIRELILFNKKNLSLLIGLSKDEFKKGVSLIEKLASFGIDDYSEEDFKKMIKQDISSLEKDGFLQLLGRTSKYEEKADEEEIEAGIKEMLSLDKSLLDRGINDGKAMGFMIGKVKEKYHVSGKEAADFIKKVIKSMLNN